MEPITDRHGHGRRKDDDVGSLLTKYWGVLSLLLTMIIGLVIYTHSGDMGRVVRLEEGDRQLTQDVISLKVEVRDLKMSLQEQKAATAAVKSDTEQILKAVQWQQETLRGRK